jgi:hypothetical protein
MFMKTPFPFLFGALLMFVNPAAHAWQIDTSTPDTITLRDFKLIGDLNTERATFMRLCEWKIRRAAQ